MTRLLRHLPDAIPLALCLLVAAIYCYWIVSYAQQAPGSEDVGSTVQPLLDFFGHTNWFDKYNALGEQQAEHHLFATRLLALLSIACFGYLHIPFWYLCGGVLVLGILAIIYGDERRHGVESPWMLLVYELLLLNPAYRTGSFAGWGISNFASMWLPMLAILAMVRSGVWAFVVFELLSYLSINTQGNGLLLVPLAAMYYLRPSARDWRWYSHLLVSAVIVFDYARNFSDEANLLQNGYDYLWQHPVATGLFYITGVLCWIGQWVVIPENILHEYALPGVLVAATTGALLTAIAAVCFFRQRQYLGQFPARTCMLVYALATLLAATWNRILVAISVTGGTDMAVLGFILDTRYTFYSLCCFILALSLVLSLYRRDVSGAHSTAVAPGLRGLPVAGLLLAAGFWAGRYAESLPFMDKDYQKNQACIAAWQHQIQPKPCLWHGNNGMLMRQAEAEGWLRIGRMP